MTWPRVEKIKKACKRCNAPFSVFPSVIKKGSGNYCSTHCANLSLWEDKKYRENQSRSHLGKMKGDKSPLWKGGRDSSPARIIRRSTEYKHWRKGVFLRDGFSCVLCHSKKSGNLNADHFPIAFSVILKEVEKLYGHEGLLEMAMIFPKLWDINNGRTLCTPCHLKTDNYGNKAKMYVIKS